MELSLFSSIFLNFRSMLSISFLVSQIESNEDRYPQSCGKSRSYLKIMVRHKNL